MDTLKRLFPYLWAYKWRVIAALTFMVGAKVANVGVPLLLKDLVDAMSFKPGDVQAVLVTIPTLRDQFNGVLPVLASPRAVTGSIEPAEPPVGLMPKPPSAAELEGQTP